MRIIVKLLILGIVILLNVTIIVKSKVIKDYNNLTKELLIENINLKNDIIKTNLYADSIEEIKDSINEELFISNYKLERIKKYNRIAGKGNNIKYLRGWINRVINE